MFYRSRPVYQLFGANFRPVYQLFGAGAKKPGRKAINPPRNAIRRIRHASNDCERAY
ncbi:hypothetical protein LTSEINV_5241 [Salmonella enterica subsp. enterica serovar Inverness str. R8-3668]|uniref:Uncharacterized protein n=1 Tax=Salmonella enterica subsp. enterica serovar Inverness str. R8-3668 TaxID=913075 RepID=G5NJJ0_SALET|nr:hypothetical protein LTSEINV_5241 [Salmonella enterica subsp. enterica serovar Inverness str. R8-3668]